MRYFKCKQTSNTYFRFLEKQSPASYTSKLAGQMHKYDPMHILSGSSTMESFEKDLIDDIINRLSIHNFRWKVSIYISLLTALINTIEPLL